jgi:histidine ammonia-lyase
MGGFAARKCLEVIENVETVVAIELLAACQALEFHRPLKTTAALEAVHKLLREGDSFSIGDNIFNRNHGVAAYEQDRFMAPDIAAATELVKSGKIWETVRPFLENSDDLVDPLIMPEDEDLIEAESLFDASIH